MLARTALLSLARAGRVPARDLLGVTPELLVRRGIKYAPSDPEVVPLPFENSVVHWSEEGALHDPTAPVTVLVHGSPGSSRDFRYLAPALQAHTNDQLRILRLNMPGEGTAPIEACPSPTAPALGAFTARAIDHYIETRQLQPSSLTLVGHSMGGPVSMYALSLRASTWLQQFPVNLALLAPVSFSIHRGMRTTRPALRRAIAMAEAAPRWIRDLFYRYAQHVMHVKLKFPKASLGNLEELRRSLLRANETCFDQHTHVLHPQLTQTLTHRPAAAVHPCRGRLIYTSDDHLVEPEVFDGAFTLLSQVGFDDFGRDVIESGGHNLQKTQADLIGQSLAQHLLQSAKQV
ncbi:uncharacterized protein MONBRDRAFT_26725 [Monosiga brevicollis MX1]|uniref:AB hydrolase-1 domain-containing protein n=1 Tax=Monosiga brevicollis TaxID=81824 RepID=A9V368_MONBE|nr:uncharacterized protein MONBRDRAFT_26725 [Monosiga brevicollis MX1]EDQ88135.1 predicted protein [Monosiga brevicollis MX1]|eukprot:XP_001747211.1 hypothetical protein [Monosiga brevicollis MX1]